MSIDCAGDQEKRTERDGARLVYMELMQQRARALGEAVDEVAARLLIGSSEEMDTLISHLDKMTEEYNAM